jgi:hypothetical protein
LLTASSRSAKLLDVSNIWRGHMRLTTSLLLSFLPISCSSIPFAAQSYPTASVVTEADSDVRATLIATVPSVEVTFDGKECTVSGDTDITVGEHVLVFHNLSEKDTHLSVDRHYPGNSWDDALDWVEENCGPPGAFCDHDPPWMVPVPYSKSTFDGLSTRYLLYDFSIAADYSLWAYTSGLLLWPCGRLSVAAE